MADIRELRDAGIPERDARIIRGVCKPLEDEIARLEAEVAAWQERHNTACENYEDELSKRTRLEAEVRALRASEAELKVENNTLRTAEMLLQQWAKNRYYPPWKDALMYLRARGLLEE